MSWWGDLVAAVESAAGGESNVLTSGGQTAGGQVTVPSVPSIPGAALLAGIWSNLRDYKMWRSLGWLLLGIVLMLLGVSWWLGPSAARSVPGTAAVRRLA